MQEPPHRIPAAPQEPRVVDVQLVVATSDREEQSVGAETDARHVIFARFELRGSCWPGAESAQEDFVHGTMAVLAADIVKSQDMVATIGGGA
jgi:hypothetical protein